MENNQIKWRGVRTPDPPEPLLISTVDPSGVFLSRYNNRTGTGTSIVYTVPPGTDYLHLTNYSLNVYAGITGTGFLEIHDDTPAFVAYIAVLYAYTGTVQVIAQPLLPSILIPPEYSIRLRNNVGSFISHAVIHGKLSEYQY